MLGEFSKDSIIFLLHKWKPVINVLGELFQQGGAYWSPFFAPIDYGSITKMQDGLETLCPYMFLNRILRKMVEYTPTSGRECDVGKGNVILYRNE